MDTLELNLERQIKTAERDKLLAETEKAISEKKKLDLESDNLRKDSKRKWILKKEFWSLLIGSLVAWTVLLAYIIPLSEAHNSQVTRVNEDKTDSLRKAKKQLDTAKFELKRREQNLTKANSLNRTLVLRVDSFSIVLNESINSATRSNKQLVRLSNETVKLQNYLDQYNRSQKTLLNKPTSNLLNPEIKENRSTPTSNKHIRSKDLKYSADIENERVIITDNREGKMIGWLPRADWEYACLVFSKDSKMLFIGTMDGKILSFELASENIVGQVELPLKSTIQNLSIDMDGSTFIVYTGDGDITKWDKSGRLVSIVRSNDKSKYESEH